LLLIFLAFGIRTSWFQTWLAHQASSYFSKEFGTEVYIDKVDIVFFDEVNIEGVFIEDIQKDTFLYTELIHADIADWSLSDAFVDVSNVELVNGHIHMRKYEGDTTLNFQHIVDYFASDEVDTTSSEFKVGVQQLNLTDIHFIFDDQNADTLENGMDFSHMDIRHLSGQFSNFSLQGPEIGITLNDLQFEDKSGLKLTKLSTDLSYGPEAIELNKLHIGLNNSYLLADYFKLKTPNGAKDWADFVHKVRFDANLHKSRLYFADLAFFVPDIWGMTDYLDINNIDIKGPIYGMKLKNVDLSMLDNTVIQGDFVVPHMDDIASVAFREKITLLRTSISDLKKLNLRPVMGKTAHEDLIASLNNYQKAGVIQLKNAYFDGFLTNFVVDGELTSGLGNVSSEYGLQFAVNEDDGLYHYKGSGEESLGRHVIVENIDLGTIAGNSMLGELSGYLKVDGKGFAADDLDVNFSGDISKLGMYGYDYNDIGVNSGNFSRNKFTGEITVEDDNLALKYNGSVDLNTPMYFDFNVKIDSAQLANLNPKQADVYQRFSSEVNVKIHGTSPNELYGTVEILDLEYDDDKIEFTMDKMVLAVTRDPISDTIILRSPYVDLDLDGKFNLEDMTEVMVQQFSYVLNNIVPSHDKSFNSKDFFNLEVRLTDVNSILQFYDENIYVAGNSIIRSEFNYAHKDLVLDFNSSLIDYHGTEFTDIKLENHFDSTKANIYYEIDHLQLHDSLAIRNVYFDSYIKNNRFITNFGWDGIGEVKPALFAFETEVTKSKDILTEFRPSFFFLKEHQYKINPKSKFLWNPDQMVFQNFVIGRGDHYLGLEGKVSKNPDDWLYVKVHDFNLTDLNGVIGPDFEIAGNLNVDGKVGDVYKTIKFEAKTNIDDLVVNKEDVGDVFLNSRWFQATKSIAVNGDLKRNDLETFTFGGKYYIERKKDNIQIEAKFNQTDISFFNAFEDPELYTDIEGILDGRLQIRGELNNPIVTGHLDVVKAKLKVPMFNVFFGLGGQINFNDGEIIADKLILMDQEGKPAVVQMQIYHYDWADWNYNILLDMDVPGVTDKFLAMDTKYQEGSYYYGKAYLAGFVNIFGYGGKTEIEVDLSTKKGTDLVLPMYGTSELEENSFVIFDETFFLPDSLKNIEANEEITTVKRSGMTLSMDFHVTKDAEVKIIFDPLTGDQIVSKGEGDLHIGMDEYGELDMRGEYIIREGAYNMRLNNLVEEDFVLEDGSSVQWTGSPYDALIAINAIFIRNLSLADIMPPEAPDRGNKKDEIMGYLQMTNTLMSPELSFDIKAPDADDLGQKAINGIKADQDELNKQFFALLVLKRFIPMYGGSAGGGNVALGLLETQVNSILGGISETYALEADLSEGQTTLGVSTQLNERTTITTSFGVLSGEDGEKSSGSSIVGDVDVEYRLNDDGTFTMNFFNETNQSSVTSQGHFTQGVSLHYQETFNTTKEFRLLQGFLNIFRKKENDVDIKKDKKKNSKWQPLPEESTDTTPN